jgi:hypothetical protein
MIVKLDTMLHWADPRHVKASEVRLAAHNCSVGHWSNSSFPFFIIPRVPSSGRPRRNRVWNNKELTECISEVERIDDRVNSNKRKEWLTIKEEVRKEQQEKEEEVPTTVTLDGYFIHNNANFK